MPRFLIAPLAAVCCVVLAACQSTPERSSPPPSPETASAAVPASSPPARIRGIGTAPSLAGQSYWSVRHCTSDGTVKVCN
ncbi:hypothetical protein NUV25_24350 [Burkholderia pseudomultivorans]|uniref:hypothetical protein n=1 Tax=Burkholderia pseudomultivorans TaxID=1207504 RepID=UPI002876B98C|nr:hypothetical protein [Burkholderia pseudomultivorans]MDS0860848.1 hypothetical protein [Burkholderia pseudomultivorans]